MTATELLRLAAFTDDPRGGNPAGVRVGPELPESDVMQRIAADVGYSETAFLAPVEGGRPDDGHWKVRYYSPLAEVPFCGHATIASGVALGRRYGEGVYAFETAVGDVPVEVRILGGATWATLTSVEPESRPADGALLAATLPLLGWSEADFDPAIPPALAFAGAWHLVLALASRETLAGLDYDFDGLQRLMLEHDLTTLQLVYRVDDETFHARNPFPVGGIVEDPATGAAAAALGGYLRQSGRCPPPAQIVIHQGEDMGRPSTIQVEIPASGGIRVSGTAVSIA